MIGLALCAANLPFINERVLGVIPVPVWTGERHKPFLVRLAELVVLFLAVGGIAYWLEARIGTAFPQGWEFYWISGLMFVVLAFPGFVLRYLRKPRR